MGQCRGQSSNPSRLVPILATLDAERLDIGVPLARNLLFAPEQLKNPLRLGLANQRIELGRLQSCHPEAVVRSLVAMPAVAAGRPINAWIPREHKDLRERDSTPR